LYGYPDSNFQVVFSEPFEVRVEKGRILHDDRHPKDFISLMNMIRESEDGEVMVRELGIGLNPEISINSPLSDVNAYERALGVHLSLGKKHGIFGKKLSKKDIQKYHIDVFLNTEYLDFSGKKIVFDTKNLLKVM
jgi:aminopeptidase